jgi:cytochrome b561
MMFALLIALFVVGWIAAAALGTQVYFLGEQSKPIHERNWRSQSFAQLAEAVTGKEINYGDRVPGYGMDAYASNLLPDA